MISIFCLSFHSGISVRALAGVVHIGRSSISNLIKEVSSAIVQKMSSWIRTPQTVNEWLSVEHGFLEKFNFRTIGAIDGKLVQTRCPPNSGSMCFSHKQKFGFLLLAICDSDGRFIYTNIGYPGSASDSKVLTKSCFYEAYKNNTLNLPPTRTLPNDDCAVPPVFIGDSGFAIARNLMRPYADEQVRGHRRFNYRLSRARMIIECSFGRLAASFPVLKGPLDLEYTTGCTFIHALCILHNYKLGRYKHHLAPYRVDPMSIRVDPNRTAQCVRDTLCAYFEDIERYCSKLINILCFICCTKNLLSQNQQQNAETNNQSLTTKYNQLQFSTVRSRRGTVNRFYTFHPRHVRWFFNVYFRGGFANTSEKLVDLTSQHKSFSLGATVVHLLHRFQKLKTT